MAISLLGDTEGAPPSGSRSDASAGRTERKAGVVLVVDDDTSILDTVTAILDNEGYEAVGLSSGAEAVAFARTTLPALILLDMRMPGTDGWTVARTLRASKIDVPIVVMTAAENARRWADEISAAGYLSKPFTLDELLDCVGKYRRDRSKN